MAEKERLEAVEKSIKEQQELKKIQETLRSKTDELEKVEKSLKQRDAELKEKAQKFQNELEASKKKLEAKETELLNYKKQTEEKIKQADKQQFDLNAKVLDRSNLIMSTFRSSL